jgi:hypothetical protein
MDIELNQNRVNGFIVILSCFCSYLIRLMDYIENYSCESLQSICIINDW